MEEREQDGEPVGGDGLQHDAAALDVMEQVAVREHRALGPAGRAGGVDDHSHVGFCALGKRRMAGFRSEVCGCRIQFLQLLDAE